MKFIDFFAGIGGFRRGMELAGHKCVGFCEFDKFAVASYTSMHLLTDKQREYLSNFTEKQRQKEILKEEYRNGEWYAADIRRVYAGDIPKADCWCFGFPCQDISVAGKQLGFQGNRSSLFFRVMYLIGQLEEENKPTYLFIENVKNLLSVNGGWDFARLLIEMDRGGYDAEWQVLNSRDFGVPQNRERCFIIGHLRGRSSSEVFPVERTSGENRISIIAHRDGFHRNLQTFSTEGICETLDTGQGGGRGTYVPINILNKDYRHAHEAIHDTDGICGTLMARDYKDPKRVCIPVLTPDRAEKRQNGRRFKDDGDPMFTLTSQDRHGVAVEPIGIVNPQGRKTKVVVPKEFVPTLRSQSHGNEPNVCIKVAEASKQGYSECRVGIDSVNLSVPGSKTRRGRVGKEVANTLDTSCNQGIFVKVSDELIVYAVWYEKYQCYISIRKLTPKECFRLQGWTDDYFEKAAFVNSDSQLYKEAGNGVTVSVIAEMAKKMMC
jgi:DNA (cytosine-5)-methyltransferase 1